MSLRGLLIGLVLTWAVSAQAQTITLVWDAPTGYTPDGYVMYRDGQNLSGSALITALTYTDTTVQQGQTYCYTVRARLDTRESKDSNQACGTVPLGAPTMIQCTITFPATGGTATMACQGQ